MKSPALSARSPHLLAALSLLLLGALGMLPPTTPPWLRLVPGLLGGLILLNHIRKPSPIGGLHLLVVTLMLTFGIGLLWQVAMPVALLVLYWAGRRYSGFGSLATERGHIPLSLTLLCALVTPIALVSWVILLKPNLSDLQGLLPVAPLWILLLGGAAFALFNALFEECIWRGVIQSRLSGLWGVRWAILIQALSFGVAHSWGFPRGVVGVLLAGTWALMLGMLRQVSGGLLAPVLAHIVADASIAAIVIFML